MYVCIYIYMYIYIYIYIYTCTYIYIYVHEAPWARQVLLAGLGMRLKKLCLKERLPAGFKAFRAFRVFRAFRL